MDTKVAKIRPKSGGRVAGTPNKVTMKAREAFAMFVEGNVHRMQEWLDAVAEDPKHGPKVALDCLLAVSEYHIPKLARTEHVGDGGGPLAIDVRLNLIEQITSSIEKLSNK